jgi:ribonuclease VapC
MLVIDASALVAIVSGEDDAENLLDSLAATSRRCVSALNLLEARLVITFGRGIEAGRLEDLLAKWDIDVVALDDEMGRLAFDAYQRFGKGRHAARLNMGDCAAYALAKARGWPLLFKGDDFSQTDVERA